MVGERPDMSQCDKERAHEDEDGDGLEAEGDLFGVEHDRSGYDGPEYERAIDEYVVDVDRLEIAQEDICHRIARAFGGVYRGEIIDGEGDRHEDEASGERDGIPAVAEVPLIMMDERCGHERWG